MGNRMVNSRIHTLPSIPGAEFHVVLPPYFFFYSDLTTYATFKIYGLESLTSFYANVILIVLWQQTKIVVLCV